MISKATRGKGFSGSISYICSKSDNVILRNIVGSDWRKAAAQMRLTASAYPKSQKPVYHSWLSFSPSEKLTDEQMIRAMDLMISKLGLQGHQSVYAVHRDVNHWHIHCVTNLISSGGNYNHLDHDFRKRPVYAREIERDMGLQKYERKSLDKISGYDVQNVFSSERMSQIRDILKSSRSADELSNSLFKAGIKLSEKSSRSNSLNYRLIDVKSGLYIAGSKVSDKLSSPLSLKRYFNRDNDKPNPKHIKPSQKDTDISLALKIRECLDKSNSWRESEIRLKEIGIEIDFIKSCERIRGIRFINIEKNINIKASDIGISYSKIDKQFQNVKPNPSTSQPEATSMSIALNPSPIQSVSPLVPNMQNMQNGMMQTPMMQISPLDFANLRQSWLADAESSIRQSLQFKEYQLQQQNMLQSLSIEHQRRMIALKQKHKSWFMPSIATMFSLKLGIPALTNRSREEIDNIKLLNTRVNDARLQEDNFIKNMVEKNYCSLSEYAVRKMMGIDHQHHLTNDIARAEMIRSNTKSLKCELNGNDINILTINNKIIGYSVNGADAIPLGGDEKNTYAIKCYNEMNKVENSAMKEIYERHNVKDARVLTPETLQEMQNIFGLNQGALVAIKAATSIPLQKPKKVDPIKAALTGSMPVYKPRLISEKLVVAAAEILAKRAAEQPAAPVRSSGRDR